MYTQLCERFREGIRTGVYRLWSNEEIASLVKKEMFDFEPLQELEESDSLLLFDNICRIVSDQIH